MKSTNSVISGCGFHHVTLKVKDFDKTVEMYKKLGFVEYAMWGVDDVKYILLDMGDGNYLEITNGAAGSKEGVINHFAVRADDCKAAYKKALEEGFTSVIEPMEIDLPSKTPMAVTFAFVAGPDGEEMEFFQQR